MTAKQIAKDGSCDFNCWKCEIEAECKDYNDRHNDNISLNQSEARKMIASDMLKRDLYNREGVYNESL